ncbi:uncharacterized protein LOC118755096 [Rhagoletis pomonella]|uniref:uncharacterized protein LOC118755096 n=1 Tax=Rhagoletis pomonella TaxID=28610 RepID=UPI001786378E|nr:uncharacterized protein LOC118755096 [Rhagoletis pomonella]
MDSEDLAKYSVMQLRAWLRQLQLPSGGNKSSLIVRLNDVPMAERGSCPVLDGMSSHLTENERDEQMDQHTEGETAAQTYEKNKSSDGTTQAEQPNQQTSVSVAEFEMLKREAELLRREKDLLERENILLLQTVRGGEIPSCAAAARQKISLEMIKTLVPDYDGGLNFSIWIAQLKSVADAYTVNENELRVLMLSKLKGKAQKWLQSKPDFAIKSVNNLIDEMNEVFGLKENRILMRRRFEARKWKAGEKFVEYLNDKVILANPLQLEEEEIVEYVIEGISDYRLRTQAYLQCYSTKAQLLQAFSKVEIKATSTAADANQREVRCYNCNIKGHIAADCRKPKREFGACYVCGSKEHRAAVCSNKKGVHLVEDYNV